MADYFIDPAGSNGNAGTSAGPGNAWQDLSYAIANVGASDTIHAAAGAYPADAGSLTITAPVTILGPNSGIPYDGARNPEAVFNQSSILQIRASDVVIDGIELAGAPSSAIQFFVGDGVDNTQILNNRITGAIPNYGIWMPSTSAPITATGISILGNLIDGPAQRGLYIFPTTPGGDLALVDGMVISGNKIANATGWGNVIQHAPNLAFTGNIIENCKRGLELKGGAAPSAPAAWSVAADISNNTFTSGAGGAYLMSFGNPSDSMKINDTVVFRNNTLNWDSDAGALWYMSFVGYAAGITYEGNTLNVLGTTPALTVPLVFFNPGAGTYDLTGNSIVGDTAVTAASSAVVVETGIAPVDPLARFSFQDNSIADFDTAFLAYDGAGAAPGGLPVGIDFVIKSQDLSSNTSGVVSGAGGVIDARGNIWGGTGPSGGAVDPVSSAVANGTGVIVSSFVQFDPFGTDQEKDKLFDVKDGVQVRVNGTQILSLAVAPTIGQAAPVGSLCMCTDPNPGQGGLYEKVGPSPFEWQKVVAPGIRAPLFGYIPGISNLNRFFDHSVNMARTFMNHDGELMLVVDEKTSGQPAGNFNGGGSGNKPLCGIGGYEGTALGNFPVIDLEAELRTPNELGVSFNCLIDLSGVGAGPNVVGVITNTLNGRVDKYAKSGAAASLTDFDINNYGDGGTYQTMFNVLYIVLNLPSYIPGTQTGIPGGDSWTSNPINLDALLNGTTMPITGAQFTHGYPNAKLVTCQANQCISTDGGLPEGIKLAALFAQLGGSGNAVRTVTAITQFSLGGVSILP